MYQAKASECSIRWASISVMSGHPPPRSDPAAAPSRGERPHLLVGRPGQDRPGRPRTTFGMRRRLSLVLAAACASTLAIPAVAASHHPSRAGTSKPRYDVTITRTDYGIPHIVAHNYGSLGYGYGYVFAQDNICTMAADYITVEGRRSRW